MSPTRASQDDERVPVLIQFAEQMAPPAGVFGIKDSLFAPRSPLAWSARRAQHRSSRITASRKRIANPTLPRSTPRSLI